jgi:hypothetical protein
LISVDVDVPSLIAIASHLLASCLSLSASRVEDALSISKMDRGSTAGFGGGWSVLSLSLISKLLLVLGFVLFCIRGTFIVAETAFFSRSRLFSRREASEFIVLLVLIGGAIVKEAEIFDTSSSDSFFS